MGNTEKPKQPKTDKGRRVTLSPPRSVSPFSETHQSNKQRGPGPTQPRTSQVTKAKVDCLLPNNSPLI